MSQSSNTSPSEDLDVAAKAMTQGASDPVLLGVALPLSTTLSAAKQVVSAWRACLLALFDAAKAKTKASVPAAPQEEPPVTPVASA